MVQRYDMEKEYSLDINVIPVEEHDGAYVKYEDYEKLSYAIESLLAAVKKGHLDIEQVQGYLEGIQKGFSI